MDLTRELTEDLAPRLRYLYAAICLFFCIVGWRLVRLQLVEGDHHRLFALEHSIKATRVPAARGPILDRHGTPLVLNRPAIDIVVTPQELGDPDRVAASVAALAGIAPEEVTARLARRKGVAPYQPVVLVEDVPYDVVARTRAWQTAWPDPGDPFDLRGVDLLERTARTYPEGGLAPHVVGYLREINPDELAAWEAKSPGFVAAGDAIGATGLEAVWDTRLRGRPGYVERLVDARGREVDFPELSGQLRRTMPVGGAPLQLTLDARLQHTAIRAFDGKTGAVVAIDPNTGGILALYSAPAYDLVALHGPDRRTTWRALLADPDKPLLNRAVQSAYPPGSTYKIVTAAAGLAEHAIQSDETIHCHGALSIGGRSFGCWRRGGHGAVNLRRALAESCDVFFYTVGLRLGPDRLADYARRFGLGRPTGIDLPHERGGLIPTTEWKLKNRKAAWQAGETLSIAIGQGYDSITPLQAAVMVATVANGGQLVHPHLVVTDYYRGSRRPPDGQSPSGPPFNAARAAVNSLAVAVPSATPVVPSPVIEKIRDGLEQVVASPSGTAHFLMSLGIPIAGKTGTAQVISLLKGKGHGKFADHAWFVAYAPAAQPTIAIAVLVEHGGHGGTTAAPIAGTMIRAYLGEK